MAFVRSSGWWGGNPQGQRAGNRLVSAGEDPRNKDRRLRREKADREARVQAAKDLIGMGGFGAAATAQQTMPAPEVSSAPPKPQTDETAKPEPTETAGPPRSAMVAQKRANQVKEGMRNLIGLRAGLQRQRADKESSPEYSAWPNPEEQKRNQEDWDRGVEEAQADFVNKVAQARAGEREPVRVHPWGRELQYSPFTGGMVPVQARLGEQSYFGGIMGEGGINKDRFEKYRDITEQRIRDHAAADLPFSFQEAGPYAPYSATRRDQSPSGREAEGTIGALIRDGWDALLTSEQDYATRTATERGAELLEEYARLNPDSPEINTDTLAGGDRMRGLQYGWGKDRVSNQGLYIPRDDPGFLESMFPRLHDPELLDLQSPTEYALGIRSGAVAGPTYNAANRLLGY